MISYLLDTNHASPLVTKSHPLRKRFQESLDVGHQFAICVPVLTETLFGIGLLPRAAENQETWSKLSPNLPCYAVNEVDGAAAAQLQIIMRRQGKQLETIDAIIAVIALRYDLVLLTADKDFSPIPNLRRENWLSS